MATKWVKRQIAAVTGSSEVLKKKRIQAKREKVAKTAKEQSLEREYYYKFTDKAIRRKMRTLLTRTETDAMALCFDMFSPEYEHEKITQGEFVLMVLNGAGVEAVREEPLTKEILAAHMATFEHAKVFPVRSDIIPGKEHPYVAKRKEGKISTKAKRVVFKEVIPEPTEEEIEEKEIMHVEDTTLTLHELLLSTSFWKKQFDFYTDVKWDLVSHYFYLFDTNGQKSWTKNDFARALRVLLVGLYVCDYEEEAKIPIDCDPAEKTREDEEEAKLNFRDEFDELQGLDRQLQRLRKNVFERYLDIIFQDMDKASMGVLDIDDVQEWLDGECPEIATEFVDKETGESTLLQAFQSVECNNRRMELEMFYPFVENSQILAATLNDSIELRMFELSCQIAQQEFPSFEDTSEISLQDFRLFLRNSPDKRIASVVVRVSNVVSRAKNKLPKNTGKGLIDVLSYQKTKPKFRKGTKSKDLFSTSLAALRKEFLNKSPLEQLSITPVEDLTIVSPAAQEEDDVVAPIEPVTRKLTTRISTNRSLLMQAQNSRSQLLKQGTSKKLL
uniref:EF-hand domain-containing protein n=1 Tax=Mucochytrium quahogii TaxID=96639 RepID=A0A7S2RV80_9STRA|mmetsp:Transcript_15187/g.26801  ORF Transcript_15187/g.26801 Transcript_15187/m.26801 type:complete len:557 (-) Transcript_15187:1826-3496(-)|eukprot:CAMPEP_0203764120 /NCGR_PEP_ID=MMETSP0098-20131031/17442_1 /ASSEMBLY_ACC=CAM_ASM_000208 /TAXON_ID=96639 /ORGANISM=" , Strain NY0313808BC1" /LENGTH=556 /DNA_ID=CAMNT_0050659827 /DNA_START=1245 /DNA_END=2915 /DNA_ORIENTATION=+